MIEGRGCWCSRVSCPPLYRTGPQKTMIHPRNPQRNLGRIFQSVAIFRLIGGIFQKETNFKKSYWKGHWCHHWWGHGLVDITVTPPSSIEDVSINLKHSSQASQYFITDQGSSLGKFQISVILFSCYTWTQQI